MYVASYTEEKVSDLSCITKIVLVAKTIRLVMWERVQQ